MGMIADQLKARLNEMRERHDHETQQCQADRDAAFSKYYEDTADLLDELA